MNKLIKFFKEEEGATMAEYGLLIALIIVAAATAISSFGGKVGPAFSNGAAQF